MTHYGNGRSHTAVADPPGEDQYAVRARELQRGNLEHLEAAARLRIERDRCIKELYRKGWSTRRIAEVVGMTKNGAWMIATKDLELDP